MGINCERFEKNRTFACENVYEGTYGLREILSMESQ